jgi:hypothetical protein
MLRTILGVIVGFVAWSVIWLAGGQLAQLIFPGAVAADRSSTDARYLLGLLALSAVASLFAGYLARWISKSQRITSELIVGLLLLLAGVVVEMGYWGVLPLWYHAAFVVLLLPMALLGGRLRGAR